LGMEAILKNGKIAKNGGNYLFFSIQQQFQRDYFLTLQF